MTISLHRPLRLALAIWFGALGLAPAMSLADTIEGLEAANTDAPADLAPDAIAIIEPAEIKKTLDDLTIYGRYVDGENWIEYHLPDGRTAYWEKGCTYPGKWWIENGQVCYAYPTWDNGRPQCFMVYQSAQLTHIVWLDPATGEQWLISNITDLAAGNPDRLPLDGAPTCGDPAV